MHPVLHAAEDGHCCQNKEQKWRRPVFDDGIEQIERRYQR